MFDAERSTDASKMEYTTTVTNWYDRLVRHGRGKFNPLEHAMTEFGWEREDPDNRPLEATDVRALYDAAESLENRLLVVALAGWGLRSGEAARLHQRQLVGLDSDDPRLDFQERKNGPSSVSLLYGLSVLKDRRNALAEDETWNGYLFPSSQSSAGHIASNTVRNRFRSLASDAGVQVRGHRPKPHMARRFWYTAYQQATANLLDRLEGIAADQGSASAEVVAQSYLSNEELRTARRDAMREKLAEALERAEAERPSE
ncbi:tyrosine-type recombinase/integrase [Halorussus lipolyticus]|uniref:tyrosine-type recombinase/integrase n=1 Tax=Halorussus lipolyticus TaxID=3034024 RepID=UPI0023E7DC5C|nr:tyrosine-type recombinase/integrase [Halorussus sp. DT80]